MPCCWLLRCASLFTLSISSLPGIPGTVSMGTAPGALPVSEGFAPASLPSEVNRSRLTAIKTKICDAIACQPAVIFRLTDELDCLGLLPVSVQQAVKYSEGKSPYEKADTMISPIIERIRDDPRKFAPALMRALNRVGLGYVTTETNLIASGESSSRKSGCESISWEVHACYASLSRH